MNLVVNGEPRDAPPGATVLALLESLGCPPGRVAVEVNGEILKRAEFGRARLRDGDRIEVVQFVGGG